MALIRCGENTGRQIDPDVNVIWTSFYKSGTGCPNIIWNLDNGDVIQETTYGKTYNYDSSKTITSVSSSDGSLQLTTNADATFYYSVSGQSTLSTSHGTTATGTGANAIVMVKFD